MRSILIGDVEIPVHEMNTLIVGSGAAALKCADRLHALGVENIAIVSEKVGAGTSNNSGSDKQTYYKLGMASSSPDSPYDMAEDLFSGGGMHGDLALVEALESPEAFFFLVSIGVPFPRNRFGGFTGYKTDHDPRQRGTSAGPYTSMQMFRCLLHEVRRRRIAVFDRHEAVSLVTGAGDDGKPRTLGVLALDRKRFDAGTSDPAEALVLFMAENVVFAVGGPGGIYERSVYPEGHTGAIGLALEAGAVAANLTESQYGLASIKFRWNVSGTYQQVIPRYVSTDATGGDAREFLNDFFPDMGKLATAVFLKGYQWPFDPGKIADYGSSLIDLLVYRETVVLGRRVFLDFRENPRGNERTGRFEFDALEPEAYDYLKNSDALFGTPIERLSRMNPMAIDLYARHGIDLRLEALEIAVCAQHNNGGLAADIWWESENLRHFFPIGEVNGSHGVYRPGGSALNSGQVGAQRAAEKIANVYAGETFTFESFAPHAEETARRIAGLMRDFIADDGDNTAAEAARNRLQHRMTLYGAHIRSPRDIEGALDEARRQLREFPNIRVKSRSLIPQLLTTRHLLIAHQAYLSAIAFYLAHGGGSRGSYLVRSEEGELIHGSLEPEWRFRSEKPELREAVLLTRLNERGEFDHAFEPRREIPRDQFWFETVWNEFLKKSYYG